MTEWTPESTSPMCPYCGDEVDDTPLEMPFPPGDVAFCETDCGGCEKPVMVRRTVKVTYSAMEAPRDDD